MHGLTVCVSELAGSRGDQKSDLRGVGAKKESMTWAVNCVRKYADRLVKDFVCIANRTPSQTYCQFEGVQSVDGGSLVQNSRCQ